MTIEAISGKLPSEIKLIWAPTKNDEQGRPHLTGEIKIFKTARGRADILKMKIRVKNAWMGINKLMEQELI